MKILHVITSLRIGGAEKLLADMIPIFKTKGITIDVLLFDGVDTHIKRGLIENKVKVISLSNGSVYNPLFIFKLMPIIKQYDIVHTHNSSCQYFVALAKFLSLSNVMLITTEHSTTNRRRGNLFLWYCDIFIYGQYRKIISISQSASNNLVEHLKNSSKIITIPNGINLDIFKQSAPLLASDLHFSETDVLLIMVAAFRAQKDQDTVIRALRHLPANYKLCLVGDGERKHVCEELVNNLNLKDRVNFLGIREDIPAIFKKANVAILSSHDEGFGLVAVEAMSTRTPLIVSDVPGLREVVENAGLLFTQGDDKELAMLVKKLMADDVLYNKVAFDCENRALDFDINTTVAKYIDVYNHVLNE